LGLPYKRTREEKKKNPTVIIKGGITKTLQEGSIKCNEHGAFVKNPALERGSVLGAWSVAKSEGGAP